MNTSNKNTINMHAILMLILLSGGPTGCTNLASVKESVENSTVLPAFNIVLTDTVTKFNTGKIPAGKPIVLFFFARNCPYCDTLTENILSHIDMLKDVRLLMLSAAFFHDAKIYEEKYQLKKYDNIMLGLAYDNVFNNFNFSGYPLVVVFDGNKKIKRANIGPFSIDSIRAIIDK
jgi:thioredoxin-related protein